MELLFERALLPAGISRNVAISVAEDGTICRVEKAAPHGQICVPGLAVAGMPNLHSHAFQRGIAGLTELAVSGTSFWGWREVMYRFVERLEPADVAAIAALLYVEMLEAGYTSVAEFHYLHHQRNSAPYVDSPAMADALRDGALQAGIRQLLLPCLYQSAGFGAAPIVGAQRRFAQDTETFLRLFETLHGRASGLRTTGIALHSLRAVPAGALRDVVAALPPRVPVHIHISEQQREVDDCLKYSGKRPIDYLFETVRVDERWCLVHATHASTNELRSIAAAGAVIGLCPTTEANLGDGYFPLDDFTASGGCFGIGSDSHVSVDPREELRSAEYILRILKQRRGLIAGSAQPHCGTFLYAAATSGGARALGLPSGELVVGAPADLVVLDTAQAQFAGLPDEALLDAYIFAPRPGAVRDVLVGGHWMVRAGRHTQREAIAQAYRECVERLARIDPVADNGHLAT